MGSLPLADVIERQDGKIHEIGTALAGDPYLYNMYGLQYGFTAFEADFYNQNAVIIHELVRDWEKEHDPDNDGIWDYGAILDPEDSAARKCTVTVSSTTDRVIYGSCSDKEAGVTYDCGYEGAKIFDCKKIDAPPAEPPPADTTATPPPADPPPTDAGKKATG